MDIIYRYDPFPSAAFRGCDSAEQAVRWLRDGNRRYGEIIARVRADTLGGEAGEPMVIPSNPLSLGLSEVPGQAPVQHPFALVLGCSDARAPVELIFDHSANDLFIVRVAGNVVGSECLGSVEYAVRHLAGNLRLIAVMGHTGCGAVAAAVDLYLAPAGYVAVAETHSLRTIIDRILFVVRIADKALERRCGASASAEPGYRAALWEMSVYLNAALTAHDLARDLGLLSGGGRVEVVHGVYDIRTCTVASAPGDEQTFAPAPRGTEDFSALSDRLADSMLTGGVLRPLEL